MSDSGENPIIKSPDWLPAGWSVEVKSSKGKNVKSYIHQLTGHRFYSKPKVLEYLGSVKNDSLTPKKEIVGSASHINFSENMNGTAGSLPHEQVTETLPQENGSQSEINYGIGASEMLQSKEMGAEKSADWLPDGWTEEIKVKNGRTVKTYVDPLWGHRFYSKPQVLQYLGVVASNSCAPKNLEAQKETPNNNSKSDQRAPDTSHSGTIVSTRTPDWLPSGWIEEVKISTGRKCYVDSSTGRKFYSKPKVLEYLGTAEIDGGTSEKKKAGNNFDINMEELNTGENGSGAGKSYKTNVDKSGGEVPPQLVESPNVNAFNHTGDTSMPKEAGSNEQPGKKIGKEKHSHEGLPPGWIKETQSRNYTDRTRNISYYIDPVSEYAFSSLKDAWRYFEAGDIRKCVKKPKKREEISCTSEQSLLNVHKTKGVTTPPKVVKSQNVKTLDDTIHSSASKDLSSRKSLERKTKVNRSGGGISPSGLVESHNKNTLDHTSCTSISKETDSNEQPGRKIGMEQLSHEGLPPGWIKETKSQIYANRTRNISYYIDPVSGYVFTTLKDIWRYLEAGDISKCMKKPKKREEMGFTTERSLPNMDKIVSNTPSKLLQGPKHVDTPKQTHFSPKGGKLSSNEQNDSEIVTERGPAEGLPSGWIKVVKTEKFYIDPKSGYVFMSQKDAVRYLETGDVGTCTVKPQRRNELGLNDGSSLKTNKTGGGSALQQLQQSENENSPRRTRCSRQKEMSSGGELVENVTSSGLPPGSIKKDGILKKATGTRRNTPKMDRTGGETSMQQQEQSYTVSRPKRVSFSSPQNKMTSSKQTGIEVIVERVTPEGLPPGWIKEIRIQKRADGVRKEMFYTDPVTGLVLSSQKDVFRYVETGDLRYCISKPRSRDQLGLDQESYVASPPVMQKLENDKTKELPSNGKNVGSKRSLESTDSGVSQKRRQTRLSTTSVSDQPTMDNTGVDTSLQQLEQSHTINMPKHASFSSAQNEMTSSKQFGIEIVVERVTPDGLPPGWIKEIRIQKKADGIRKEAFYTDPVTGLVLSSQKDVFRYVESGDIRHCVCKPRSRDQLGLNQGSSAASPLVMQKLENGKTNEQLSDGKNVSSEKNLETMESDVSQKQPTRLSVASPADMQKVEQHTTSKQLFAGNNVGSKRSLETTVTDGLPKRRQTRASASAVTANTATVKLPKELPKVDNVASDEKALVDNSGKDEKTPCRNSPDKVAGQQLETVPEIGKTKHAFRGAGEALSNAEVSNKSNEAGEDQAEDQTVSQDQGLFEDETWSNPCLDFAIKTLTETSQFDDDNVQGQNILQPQADAFQVDFGVPNVCQVNDSHAQIDTEASAKPGPVTQLPNCSMFLPDMNCSFPSGSKITPLKDDSEENKNSDKNELTLDNYAKFLF